MIPSPKTHVTKSLQKVLSKILDEAYITNDLLSELDSESSQAFINKYVSQYDNNHQRTKAGQEIPILDQFPTEQLPDTYIVVGSGSGKEQDGSIGSISGDNYGYRNKPDIVESAPVTIDDFNSSITITANNFITDLEDIEGIAVSPKQISLDGNLIHIELDPYLLDSFKDSKLVRITYVPGDDVPIVGETNGIDMQEEVNIVLVSNNMPSLYALDSIVKGAFILLRKSTEETRTYQLGNLEFLPISTLQDENLGNTPTPYYAREINATYTVTYTWDRDFLEQVKKVMSNIIE